MQDILLESLFGDLLFMNGDFVVGDSDKQNVCDIINDTVGSWKNNPDIGVGLSLYQYGPVNSTTLKILIKNQLQSDGFNVSAPIITYNASTSELDIIPNAIR